MQSQIQIETEQIDAAAMPLEQAISINCKLLVLMLSRFDIRYSKQLRKLTRILTCQRAIYAY